MTTGQILLTLLAVLILLAVVCIWLWVTDDTDDDPPRREPFDINTYDHFSRFL